MSAPNIPPPFPVALALPVDLAVALAAAAVTSIQRSVKKVHHARRPRRGATLKPGVQTPLWNELAAAVQVRLTRYGEKAKLARILGMPRQRVHEMLRARHHMPDAERTLQLLVWLQARSTGHDLG